MTSITEKITVGDKVNVHVKDMAGDLYTLKYKEMQVVAITYWSLKLKGRFFTCWYPINNYYEYKKVYEAGTDFIEPKVITKE